MQVRNKVVRNRKAWELDNGTLALQVMEGGGHLSSLTLRPGPKVNPYWTTAWKSIEPWQYRPAHQPRYESQLLAAIQGHNVCLGAFGGPSPEEGLAGLGCHGEAPVARWRKLAQTVSARRLRFVCGCRLPIADMTLTREFTLEADHPTVRVRSLVTNMARRDVPFTMCEHVTFGPPFLEKGVTLFDAPATAGHTFPEKFGDHPRLRMNAAFYWPNAPGARGGKVDLRTIGRQPRMSGDFSTQLMDPEFDHAWFSAVHPGYGLAVIYVWRRSDFPWLGNWEESYGRKSAPWGGVSLTRGMEFANTPFPIGLRRSVDLGSFHGLPTYRWLPARATLELEFTIIAARVGKDCRGVRTVTPNGSDFDVVWK